jgi:hypothetical protein
MTNLPYGLMEALVADHQRELHQMATGWRLRRDRRRPVRRNSPTDGHVVRELPPTVPEVSTQAAA